MTRNPLTTARQRARYAVAETDAPVIKGQVVSNEQDKRMAAWLRAKQPNLSAWQRRTR